MDTAVLHFLRYLTTFNQNVLQENLCIMFVTFCTIAQAGADTLGKHSNTPRISQGQGEEVKLVLAQV